MRLEKPTVLDSEMEFLMKTDSYEINSALDISWQMKNKFHGAPRTPQVRLKASLRVTTGGGQWPFGQEHSSWRIWLNAR